MFSKLFMFYKHVQDKGYCVWLTKDCHSSLSQSHSFSCDHNKMKLWAPKDRILLSLYFAVKHMSSGIQVLDAAGLSLSLCEDSQSVVLWG